jgi:hypothetical protein
MTPKQRVLAAIEFQRVDVPPVEYAISKAALHEHGRRLLDLCKAYPQDFGPYRDREILHPLAGTVDAQGRYYETATDEWGTLWEYRIFGISGHPIKRPLDDWAALATYRPPVPPRAGTEAFNKERELLGAAREFFYKGGWVNIFEVMISMRQFEDVLVDLATDAPEIHRLADMILEHRLGLIDYLVAAGYDAIQVADDWGTQNGLIVSPRLWRSFFAPRYRRIVKRIHDAGKKALYHVCGQCEDLLDDFAQTGFDAIWPQLPLYDGPSLARRSRELRLALALHPDRSHLMTFGSPGQVRTEILRLADTFAILDGGSWLYVEIDNGFPYANVEMLFKTIAELRN